MLPKHIGIFGAVLLVICLLGVFTFNSVFINELIQTVSTISGSKVSQVWQPKPGTSWYIQLEGKIDKSHKVDMYEIDLFYVSEIKPSLVDELHQQEKVVICYFSAGTWENWRSDAASFHSSLLGNTLGDWPDEKWLNIQRIDLLSSIMRKRLDMASEANCDGVLPDNVDGYTNDTGFALKGEDQLAYNRWLAEEAHLRGLSVGLHNNLNQVDALVIYFDWAANEQCFYYTECDRLTPFVAAGKAVFSIEYQGNSDEFCLDAQRRSFARVRMSADRRLDQDALIRNCWD